METVTIDILNNNAIKLLENLELLQLIRMHREKTQSFALINRLAKYKGAMTKQPLEYIDKQLNELRNEWE